MEGRTAEPRRAWALNLSPGGIGLHAAERFAAGETVSVRFVLPDGGPAIRARARVVWVERPAPEAAARFREVGLRFEALRGEERDRVQAFVAGARSPAAPGG